MRLITLAFILAFIGCGSEPIQFKDNARTICTAHNVNIFKTSPYNKYLVVVRGYNSTLTGSCATDNMDARSEEIPDPYTIADIRETIKLATYKDYDVYHADSDLSLEIVLDHIMKVADDNTHLMLAMSGECDAKGFIINLVHTDGGANLVPPGKKLIAEKIIAHLSIIKGVKAVIINGCQSGCFADAARKDPDFNGVVIAACPVGYATTECQRTGTSAIYAGFLGLYQESPTEVKNLITSNISAGFWFENFRHKLSDIAAGGLPISYTPVIFSTTKYLF